MGRNMILVAYLLVGFSTLTLSIYLYSYLTRPKLKYDGVHVLVTGGSSGIGYDIAKEYLQRGANVTIVARNLQKLENSLIELKKLIKNKQQQIRIIAVDVSSNEETVKKAFQPIVSELGPVEVLINCAGKAIFLFPLSFNSHDL